MRTIEVLLFARVKDLAGSGRIQVAVSDRATVSDVRKALVAAHPALASIVAQSAFAVNNEYSANDAGIPLGAEVACIPPVSGG
jgi:molybdopterin converting factor subunit 1